MKTTILITTLIITLVLSQSTNQTNGTQPSNNGTQTNGTLPDLVILGILRDFNEFNAFYGHIDMNYPCRFGNLNEVTTGLVENQMSDAMIPLLNSVTGSQDIRTFDSALYFNLLWTNNEFNKPSEYKFNFKFEDNFYTFYEENVPGNYWYPFNGQNIVSNGQSNTSGGWSVNGNFSSPWDNLYTATLKFRITYAVGKVFEIESDDDSWVFINNNLAIDNGGYHLPLSNQVTKLDDINTQMGLGLIDGQDYDVYVFMADRMPFYNYLKIRTNAVVKQPSQPFDISVDSDKDGVPDIFDNCLNVSNSDQVDCDMDGIGDDCQPFRNPNPFPYMLFQTWNAVYAYNETNFYGLSSNFETLPKEYEFNDRLPANSIHCGYVTVDLVIINQDKQDNCLFQIDFQGLKTVLLANNFNGTYSATFDSVSYNYNYKFSPIGGGSYSDGTGLNKLAITAVNSCNLLLGSLSYITRYTYSENNTEGVYFFSNCVNKEKCKYGTFRFGRDNHAYCACWSGAYDRSCVMGNANYTTTISNPWTGDTQWDQIEGLDSENADRDFGKDWINHPTCPDMNAWETVTDLVTVSPPRMDKAYFDNNRLNIWISTPFTNGRAETVAFLNDPALNSTIPEGTYPISPYIYKEISGCFDLFHFDMPWDIAINCNWIISQEETHQIYSGQVVLQHQEWLSSILEWRFTQSVLRIKLRFIKYVSVSINANTFIYNIPNITAAITKQIVSVNLGEPALIELSTILQFPFKLQRNGFTLSRSPPGKIAKVDYDSVDCTNTQAGSKCKQRWITKMTLINNTCTLNGFYQLRWTLICSPGVNPCPINPSSNSSTSGNSSNSPLVNVNGNIVTIGYTLTSENFCAEVQVDVGLTGSLGMFADAQYTQEQSTSLKIGFRIFLLVKIDSQLNSGSSKIVTFSSTQLVTVVIRSGSKIPSTGNSGNNSLPIVVFQNMRPVVFDNSSDIVDPKVDIILDNISDPQKVGFNFLLTQELASLLVLSNNGELSFTVAAEIKATFTQNKGQKRDTEQDNESTTLSMEGRFDDSVANQLDPGSS